MNGENEYNKIYENKIKQLIEKNNDKNYLEGFYYYTCNSNLNGLSSSYNYLLVILRFMNSRNKNLDQLTLDDYTIFIGTLQNKSSTYKITSYAALKKFSTYLFATKRNNSDPMQYVSRPKNTESILTKERRQNGYLNKEEIKKYIDTVNSNYGTNKEISRRKDWKERDLAIISLFLDTGLRCAGLYKLDIDSIDFENGNLLTMEKGGKIKNAKISNNVLNVLQDWVIKREKLLNGKIENALFISNRKKRLSTKGIADIVKKYAQEINGKHITPHKLRATYATSLYNATKDIKFVKRKMGHANLSTTELYIRGEEDEFDNSSDIMEQIIPV